MITITVQAADGTPAAFPALTQREAFGREQL